jgi:hypothetical protein
MNRWKIEFVLCLSVGLFFSGCGVKRQSLGSRNKIVVIADSSLFAEIEPDLSKMLCQELYTPQPEPIFSLMLQTPTELEKLTRFPNLLIVGTLESTGKMGDLLGKFLSGPSLKRVQADSAFLFNKENAWAYDQMLAVLVSKDKETLLQNISANGQAVFDLFDRHERKAVLKMLFDRYEQKEIPKRLMNEHGWSVRVQHDYFIAVDSSAVRSVWLRRMDPQRSLFIYWEPCNDPSVLSKEWMMDRRQQFSIKFFDGDYVYEDSTITVQEKVVDFCNRYAIRLDGVWQNDKYTMGGPFRSYGFYNESDKRLYLIDLLVYAPGERKYQFLRQLDCMAATFTTQE